MYQVGDYREALDEYKAAHLAKPDPAFLYNIAQCHRQLGEYEQAITLYKRFLAASPDAANRAVVEKRVAEMEAELAERKHVPTTPRTTESSAHATMLGATAPSGSLPDATSPASSSAAPAEATVGASPTPAGSSLRYLRWVGSGLTLALVGGAIVSGVSASSKFSELKNSCGSTSIGCTASEIDALKSRALLTNILWGAAAVAAVGTGIAFYLAPRAGAVQVAWDF